MTAAARSQNVPFLPPAWAAMLKRAALFAAGLAVVMLCVLALLALVSYSPEDPSLNTAELRAAKKLSPGGTTEPKYFLTKSGYSLAASEKLPSRATASNMRSRCRLRLDAMRVSMSAAPSL